MRKPVFSIETKAQISCTVTVTAQLLAYAYNRFTHDMAHVMMTIIHELVLIKLPNSLCLCVVDHL